MIKSTKKRWEEKILWEGVTMGGNNAWIFPGGALPSWMEQEKQGGFKGGLFPAKLLLVFLLEH